MFLYSIGRSFMFALQSFGRNIWLSIATIFIIFLAFVSINFLVLINGISQSAIAAVQDKVDISVYIKTDVSESKIMEMKNHLSSMAEIKNIVYKSPELNLKEFQERHASDEKIQETLKELNNNPLGATLIVKAKELTDYPNVLKSLDNPAYSDLIEEKNFEDHSAAIDRINTIADNVKRGCLAVSIMFAIIAILIVFNTVRIAIFTHQNEIAIMKLVGAGNWFVRSPFIIESVLTGVIGCAIALALVYPLVSFVQPQLSSFFGDMNFNLISYFNANLIKIIGFELLGIIVVNIISSSLAIGKYLNV
ncbi:MAG: permease-like cell division protein FtsX [Candidatus Buchananbacteria bacterium]